MPSLTKPIEVLTKTSEELSNIISTTPNTPENQGELATIWGHINYVIGYLEGIQEVSGDKGEAA